jgi:hypothetical protein
MSSSSSVNRLLTAPTELRALQGWLIWRYEQTPGEAKPRKVPYYTNGGRRHGQQGSATDRSKLTSFAAACSAAAKRGFDGVGLAMLADWGITALDFDKCIGAKGLSELPPEIMAIVGRTYAEYSPSGEGVRAFVKGNLGNHKSLAEPGRFGFETFSSNAFVTFTNNMLPHIDLCGLEDTIADVDDSVRSLCEARFGRSSPAPAVDNDDPFAGLEPQIGLSVEQMQTLLAGLDPDMGRDDWIRVGMALHHECEGDDTGFDLWNDWSENGGKYPSEQALRAQWASFTRRMGPGRRQITMASVLKMAKEAGMDVSRLAAALKIEVPPAGIAEATTGEQINSLPFLIDRDIANTTSTDYKRRPLVEGVAYLGELMNLSSAGGLGKSTYGSMLAVSVATGKNLLNAKVPHRRKVLLINGEDSRGEITMKLHAARIHQKIPEAEVYGHIFTFGAEDAPIFCLIETDVATKQVNAKKSSLQALKDYILEQGIGLVIIDPLVSFFPGDMNANGVVGLVMLALKRIAVETDCAIVIVQHVAKGTNAKTHGAEAASGAASTVNLSRTAFGIMGIESSEAADLGIMPGDERNYFRLINTKNNLSIRSDDHLFRREAVPMGNGTEEFPDEDWVPVAVPYTPPEGGLTYPPQVLRDVLAALDKGTVDGLPFSPGPTKSKREFAHVIAATLQPHYPNLRTAEATKLAKAIVGKLRSDGWVTVAEIPVRKSTGGGGSNKGQALLVRWGMTPWAAEPSPERPVCQPSP